VRFFSLLFFILLFNSPLFAQIEGYQWPVTVSKHLSGTFGETRSAHYHSGLDIKTWGREGYPVYASKNGYLSRVAITARGYGRVLYLKHEDGYTTVYAHLQRFRKDIQDYVDSIRVHSHTFEIELYPDSALFNFKQGELIGFTGSTGIGPPHLHFEIRDSLQQPLNALQAGFNIKDDIPPTISALLIIPESPKSRINGSAYPGIYYPEDRRADTLNFGLIKANELVGITISAFDGANQVTNKYAPYTITLRQSSDTLFHETIDSFNFEEANTMFLDRIAAYGASRRSFQPLYKKDGPDIPFYDKVKNKGLITPTTDTTGYEIITTDFFGNTRISTFQMIAGTDETDITKEIKSNPRNWYWRNNWTALSKDSVLDIRGTFAGYWDDKFQQQLLHVDSTYFHTARINPDNFTSFYTPDKDLFVRFKPHTFFDTLTVALNHRIEEHYPIIEILPDDQPALKAIELQFYLGEHFEKDKNYRLFRLDRSRNRLSYVDSKLIGRTIHGYPSGTGEFAVIADDAPPVTYFPALLETDYGEWKVVMRVEDELSGIDFKRSEIQVNGIRGITEYDFEEDLLIYLHPGFKPTSGKSLEVQVIVTDHAGNSVFRTYQL
tara:strand:+ start:26599 stop:28419 length:1821 start_codon:yes stop_codon:yes gene_type:complete